jgi:hypothetical protein
MGAEIRSDERDALGLPAAKSSHQISKDRAPRDELIAPLQITGMLTASLPHNAEYLMRMQRPQALSSGRAIKLRLELLDPFGEAAGARRQLHRDVGLLEVCLAVGGEGPVQVVAGVRPIASPGLI